MSRRSLIIVARALKTTGEFLWQATPYGFGNITNLSTWQVSGKVLAGAPFEDNTVYALGGNGSSQYIFKLNIDNGDILWRSDISVLNGIPSVLAIYQGQVIMHNYNETFSLNQTSGEPLWSFNVNGLPYQPTVYGSLLLFGASDGKVFVAADLYLRAYG